MSKSDNHNCTDPSCKDCRKGIEKLPKTEWKELQVIHDKLNEVIERLNSMPPLLIDKDGHVKPLALNIALNTREEWPWPVMYGGKQYLMRDGKLYADGEEVKADEGQPQEESFPETAQRVLEETRETIESIPLEDETQEKEECPKEPHAHGAFGELFIGKDLDSHMFLCDKPSQEKQPSASKWCNREICNHTHIVEGKQAPCTEECHKEASKEEPADTPEEMIYVWSYPADNEKKLMEIDGNYIGTFPKSKFLQKLEELKK